MASISLPPELEESLAETARSFVLSLRALPEPMRVPLSIGYLAARLLDSIADSDALRWSLEERRQQLKAYLNYFTVVDESTLDHSLVSPLQVSDPKILKLLRRAGLIKSSWYHLDSFDRSLLNQLIIQLSDAFSWDTQDAEHRMHRSPDELLSYAYSAAGCVGESWTALCHHHVPSFATNIELKTALTMGRRLGQGLQLTNIIRDFREDVSNGRRYWPVSFFSDEGDGAPYEIDKLKLRPASFVSALKRMVDLQLSEVDAALGYIDLIPNTDRGLRLAVELPLNLALSTVDLVVRNPLGLLRDTPLKVSKLVLTKKIGELTWKSKGAQSYRDEVAKIRRAAHSL